MIKIISFFLIFILVTSTITPSTMSFAQTSSTCFTELSITVSNLLFYDFKLAVNPTVNTNNPANIFEKCIYRLDEEKFEQNFGFKLDPLPPNISIKTSWSTVYPDSYLNTGNFCHQVSPIYRYDDNPTSRYLQTIYSNEKLAKVYITGMEDYREQTSINIGEVYLKVAESLATQCPYGTSKSSLENLAIHIDCPDTVSNFKLDRALPQAIDDTKPMRWFCVYAPSTQKSNTATTSLQFIVNWLEKPNSTYKFDYGCTSGKSFETTTKSDGTTAGLKVYSQNYHVLITHGGGAILDLIDQGFDPNPFLQELLQKAEERAIPCEEGFVDIEKEVDEGLEQSECKLIANVRANDRIGKFTAIVGKVLIQHMGEGEWTEVSMSFPIIQAGDRIITLEKSKARIEYDGGILEDPIIMDMGGKTELCLGDRAELQPASSDEGYLEILKGQLRIYHENFEKFTQTWIDNSVFSLRSGNIFGGIRGTDFVISYEPEIDKTIYNVKEGIVDVRNLSTDELKTITDGQVLEISNGQMQPVSTLTSNVWDSLVEQTGGVITVIPDWVKNNAGWWADDMIEDSDFAQGIQYLISEGIMTIPETTQAETTDDTQGMPSWVKNNAGWWADGQITDDDFVKGIQYLVGQGIIRV